MSLRALVHRHVGRPAVCIGGGPSGPWAFVPFFGGVAPRDAVVLSANDHGYRCGLFPPVDFIVACDDGMGEVCRPYGAPIISPKRWADIRDLHRVDNNSGRLAVYAAWVMGCAPIVLIGMDCYDGATYFDRPDAVSAGNNKTIEQHIRRWRQLTELAPGIMIRATSGPLLEVFPKFDPNEPPVPPAPREKVESLVAGERLRFTRRVPNWHGRAFEVGEEREFQPAEAQRFISANMAVPI